MGYATHLGPQRYGTNHNNCGSPVLVQSVNVAFNSTAVPNIIIPAGSQILSMLVDVAVAFNSSGTDLLDVGTLANGTLFVAGQDLAVAGRFAPVLAAANIATLANVGPVDLTIVVKYTQSVADATAGAATVNVQYLLKNPDGTTTTAP